MTQIEAEARTAERQLDAIPEAEPERIVRSLRRGLKALALVVEADAPPRLSDVAAQLELDKASTLRLLATLEAEGLVARDPTAKTYRIGSRLITWLASRRHEQHFLLLARPCLETLAARTRESCHLGVLTGTKVTLVDTVAADSPVAVRHCAGMETDLHSTSVGKVLLAYAPAPLRRQLLAAIRFERHTAKTIVDPGQLEAELRKVREQGHAVDDAEFNDWIYCVAAPVSGASGEVLCAIGVSMFLPTIITDANRRSMVIAEVRDAAQALSAKLAATAR